MRDLTLIAFVILVCATFVVGQETGKVSAIKANLRGTPSGTGVVITTLSNGEAFEVIKKNAPWYLIQTSVYVGWIHGNGIKFDEDLLAKFLRDKYGSRDPGRTREATSAERKAADDVIDRVLADKQSPSDDEKVSVAEFARRIKAKYPEYAGMDDLELSSLIVRKYPVYANRVDLPIDSQITRKVPPPDIVRYETGTNLVNEQNIGGRGTLRITNGTTSDAIAKLADSSTNRTIRLVYIQSGTVATINSIGQGNYVLKFSLGTGYDRSAGKFTSARSFSRFDEILDFFETRVGNSIRWKDFEVTLNPVVGGNANTSPISAAEFEGP